MSGGHVRADPAKNGQWSLFIDQYLKRAAKERPGDGLLEAGMELAHTFRLLMERVELVRTSRPVGATYYDHVRAFDQASVFALFLTFWNVGLQANDPATGQLKALSIWRKVTSESLLRLLPTFMAEGLHSGPIQDHQGPTYLPIRNRQEGSTQLPAFVHLSTQLRSCA